MSTGRLSLAAKARKREGRLKEEFPDYDPAHGRSVRGKGWVQGMLGRPMQISEGMREERRAEEGRGVERG